MNRARGVVQLIWEIGLIRSAMIHCFGSSHTLPLLPLPHPFQLPTHPRYGQQPCIGLCIDFRVLRNK